MSKIVLIGAGSTNFGLGTIGDIFKSKVLASSTIVLHDINPDALKNITSGIDTLANESDFCKFFKMVFGCKTSDERKAFIWEVKKRKIHKQFGVTPCDPQVVPVDNRRRPVWEHGDCHFKEGTKKLFEQREYECPECGQSLPASNSH